MPEHDADRTMSAYPCGIVSGQQFRLVRTLHYPGPFGGSRKLPAGWITTARNGRASEPNVIWLEDPFGELYLIPDTETSALKPIRRSRLRPFIYIASVAILGLAITELIHDSDPDVRTSYVEWLGFVLLAIVVLLVHRSINRRDPPKPLS